MNCKIVYKKELDSTNNFLREYDGDEDMTVVWTGFQTAGRGQGTNQWESEHGKNLTFSMRIRPKGISANEQYIISMMIAVATSEYLAHALHCEIRVKWPNDIYVGDGKIAGILIENSLSGTHIKECIIGIGLNVNQRVFLSDAPNPVSMVLIDGIERDCREILQSLTNLYSHYLENLNADEIRRRYRSVLYRRDGFHEYRDADGKFSAEIVTVKDDGHIVLRDTFGRQRCYAFKDVAFVPDNTAKVANGVIGLINK
ncbi:biotin--[acetyl-CoA-carboxylase] ligase [Prevotella sp. OH937_COT-195]|uniref:biotin--[acetyl-CoA-carboxylase] ligase n=1 Tax=Prevotella sp. OH937_COT-195 TaxID=2491051 RepID=UPI000F64EB7B|nr:biotin--[acetyl-CoA-carboxylase] ligase [Prevotella sp. OH937_COT-195]RRD02324.1 biotin--[acetyl-CoA-carboxylase] ligase [Prevotella sp. OH937_COT-195]